MHTKINISTVFIKFVLKIQEANFLNIIGIPHTRRRQEGSLRRPEKRIPYTKLDFSVAPKATQLPTTRATPIAVSNPTGLTWRIFRG